MRKIWLIAAAGVFCFTLARAEEGKNPLADLKPGDVPYVPLAVGDGVGATDTLWMDMQKGAKVGEWVLYMSVFNDESLFALSFPIRYEPSMSFDSASLVGTRLDFFQTKMVNKNPVGLNERLKVVTVGLFSALNPSAPPVPPGKGLALKLFFKAPIAAPISGRSVAPIMMPPNLEFVMAKGTAIHPVVVRVGDAAAASTTEPAPKETPSKKSTRKRKSY